MRTIKADMRLIGQDAVVARGSVVINNAIKFWVEVREYIDPTTGERNQFIGYPQRRSSNPDKPYEDICYIEDTDFKYEVQEVVLKQVEQLLAMKDSIPEIKVSVSPVSASDSVVAICSIVYDGIGIKGIRIRKRHDGELLVSMPQYRDAKTDRWRDQVSSLNKKTYDYIKGACLKAYEELGA